MVEGHSVHRVAAMHRQRLIGKAFEATSPNKRFKEGAEAISGKVFYRIEAVGKNLFAFFKLPHESEDSAVCVHVHFGMAGNWAVYQGDEEVPEPTSTNRLRLKHPTESLTADLSAMTVNYGGMALYLTKRAKLGHDPLRSDADPDALWAKVKGSKKSIGALIMDQSFFTGPGNIYRAEILFKSRIHPDTPGFALERDEFDVIWKHTVELLQRGFQTGSILTVDPVEAKQLGKPKLRRYIYNTSHCPRCQSRIQTWDIASRTCYACPKCQTKRSGSPSSTNDKSAQNPGTKKKASRCNKNAPVTPEKDCVPFNSHCAPESVETRLKEGGPDRLTVEELKAQLIQLGTKSIPKGLKKAALVQLLLIQQESKVAAVTLETNRTMVTSEMTIVSSEAAAAEKAAANESLAVEHIAELAPGQARKARAQASAALAKTKEAAIEESGSAKKRRRPAKNVTPSPKKRRISPRRK